jgi:tagatose-6-phosphate ketose/aldose isomerase
LSRRRDGRKGILSDADRDGEQGFADGATAASNALEAWLGRLASRPAFGPLLQVPWAEQRALGYGHTLREICQQPIIWPKTAAAMAAAADRIRGALAAGGIRDSSGGLVLTGSGSSFFAGECVVAHLQESLGVVTRALPAGAILTHPRAALPPTGRFLVVSLARSGDSPESAAVVERLLGNERAAQLLISCNRGGALARRFGSAARVASVVLPAETNDQSLVMTSSFTNLVLAARSLSDPGERSLKSAARLAGAARALLDGRADDIATLARRAYACAVYLGSGGRLGAAHESALKMLESNGGRVATLADSFLGLRHGPMAAVGEDSLIVAFLSSDPVVRAYERDVLLELQRKGLGRWRLVVGERIPHELTPGPEDVRIDVTGEDHPLDDGELVLLDAVVGQLLAFFRCLHGGGRPDSPSSGVIQRVVESFAIHANS